MGNDRNSVRVERGLLVDLDADEALLDVPAVVDRPTELEGVCSGTFMIWPIL